VAYKGILIKDFLTTSSNLITSGDTLLVVKNLYSKDSKNDVNKYNINFSYSLYYKPHEKSEPLNYSFNFNKSFICDDNSNIIDDCYIYIHNELNKSNIKNILIEKDYPILNDALIYYDPKYSYKGGKSLISHKTWNKGTGSCVGFNQNGNTTENERLYYDGPFGNTICWVAKPDSTSGPDGGWGGFNSDSYAFNIDYKRMYRFSVWVKRAVQGSNGTFYFGTHNYDSSGSNINIYQRSDGGGTTNPYFWYTTNPCPDTSTWVLVVGHVWPYGSGTGNNHSDSGRYKTDGTKLGNITNDFVWNNNGVTSNHRTYLYYCTDTSVRQYWAYPRVDLIDGSEPTISELCSGVTETYFDLSGNNNNSFIVNGLDYLSDSGGTLKVSYNYTPNIIKTNIGKNRQFHNKPITFSAWVKSTSSNSNYRMWLFGGFSQNLYLGISKPNIRNMGINGTNWSGGTVGTDWTYQTVVLDGNVARCYNNGIYLYTLSYPNNYTININFILYGGISTSTSEPEWYFYGHVGTYIIHDRALSDDEIMYNFNIQKSRYSINDNTVIQDNLILHLDAGNTDSYTSGSTTWYDLTSNNYDAYGAPNNSGSGTNNDNFPTFIDKWGGVMEFGGKKSLTITSDMGGSDNITIDFWCYKNNKDGVFFFDARNDGGVYYIAGTSANITIGNKLTADNPSVHTTDSKWWYKWINIVLTSEKTGKSSLWINNEKIADKRLKLNDPFNCNLGQYFRIGARYSNVSNWSGYFSNIKIYDRVLTDNEINWNYQLLKNRFIDNQIITNFLILHLNASYTSGTTWIDITGNDNNFTINTSAIKKIKNIDFIDLNGDHGGCKRIVNGNLTPVDKYHKVTIIVISIPLNYSSDWRTLLRGLYDHQVITLSGSCNMGMYDNNLPAKFISSNFWLDQIDNFSSSWNFYVWKLSDTSPYYSFQYNDNREWYTITNSNATYNNGFVSIGCYHKNSTDLNNSDQYWGKIAEVFYYYDHLSDGEIHYMYNILNEKYKFGKKI